MEREKFHGLDHLRAVAILLVLLYHYRMFEHPDWIDTVGWIGWTGVDLFFVLSGFLISGQLFVEISRYGTIRLKIFFTKRFFRIIPPYAVTLLLYFCFPVFREREALPPLWKFVSFTQNYGLDVIDQGTFSHAWSLCIEEQFYLVLPLSLLLLIRLKALRYVTSGILFVLIFTLLIRLFFWERAVAPLLESPEFWKVWYMKLYYPTYTRLDGLAIGVLMGYLFRFSSRFKTIIHKNGNLLTITGILAVTFSLWFCRDQYSAQASVFGFSLVALSYGILVAGSISQSSFLGRKANMVTSQLAALSYAIYLSHKGIIHLVQRFLDQLTIQVPDTVVLVLCLISCILAGLLYRYGIERPSAQIKNKILNQYFL